MSSKQAGFSRWLSMEDRPPGENDEEQGGHRQKGDGERIGARALAQRAGGASDARVVARSLQIRCSSAYLGVVTAHERLDQRIEFGRSRKRAGEVGSSHGVCR
jgi:hypothetical protein